MVGISKSLFRIANDIGEIKSSILNDRRQKLMESRKRKASDMRTLATESASGPAKAERPDGAKEMLGRIRDIRGGKCL